MQFKTRAALLIELRIDVAEIERDAGPQEPLTRREDISAGNRSPKWLATTYVRTPQGSQPCIPVGQDSRCSFRIGNCQAVVPYG